ncbi:MAG: hypothetical protein P4L76_05310 [Beijerinckiaceae bacterium]|nr:hypothetical protein [Beijerinckiaceae bacterium]
MKADEDWTLCDWDGRAAICRSDEAHACLDGKTWTPRHPAEIYNEGRIMTRDAFEKAYPGLPPFPVSERNSQR